MRTLSTSFAQTYLALIDQGRHRTSSSHFLLNVLFKCLREVSSGFSVSYEDAVVPPSNIFTQLTVCFALTALITDREIIPILRQRVPSSF